MPRPISTRAFYLGAALLAASLAPAHAAGDCYVDYKAKQDSPLRLHYGVAEMSGDACSSTAAAQSMLAARLKAQSWTLLQVISTFDAGGLDARKADAGAYFLAY